MANSIMLRSTAGRLGIKETFVIKKSEEYLRILNSKPLSGTINDIVKVVLCLDLAGTTLGEGFDKDLALKLCKLQKSAYQNQRNNVEKILNLDKQVSVSELCVQLSCTEAREVAERILHAYKTNDKQCKDITHPQYTAAAVYTSCKINGIKIDKSQLRLSSHLKISAWNELILDFEKFSKSLNFSVQKDQNLKNQDCAAKENATVKSKDLPKTVEKSQGETIEEYKVWRERILKEAANEILQREID